MRLSCRDTSRERQHTREWKRESARERDFRAGQITMRFGRTIEMMLKRFSTTLRAGALAALFVVGTSASALALPIVSFETEGIFTSNGTNTISFTNGGTVTFTFTGVNVSVDSPSFTSFGEMDMDTTGGG